MHPAVTVKRLAPRPVMMRFLLITNSPLIRVMVPRLGAKVIVSPDEALRIACRNDPGPLSFVLVTGIVVACAGITTAQSSNATIVNIAVRIIESDQVVRTTGRLILLSAELLLSWFFIFVDDWIDELQ